MNKYTLKKNSDDIENLKLLIRDMQKEIKLLIIDVKYLKNKKK